MGRRGCGNHGVEGAGCRRVGGRSKNRGGEVGSARVPLSYHSSLSLRTTLLHPCTITVALTFLSPKSSQIEWLGVFPFEEKLYREGLAVFGTVSPFTCEEQSGFDATNVCTVPWIQCLFLAFIHVSITLRSRGLGFYGKASFPQCTAAPIIRSFIALQGAIQYVIVNSDRTVTTLQG